MWWNTAIILIWLCIFFTIVAVTIVCQKKKTGIAKPISIIFAGMLLAVYIGIFPGNYVSANYSDNDFIRFTETFFISIADLIQVFTANNNVKELLETIRSHESFFLQQAYIFTMSIMCTVAPLLTIGTLISILMSLSAGRRYLFSFFKAVYIFSELNDRSIVLASDIKNNHPNSMIVFTDVVDHEDETSLELSNRAKSIGAILFKKDILTPKFHMHRKKAEMLFFIIGDNEAENIEHSLILIERYKNRENTRLYIFSSTRESELALTGVDKGKLKVRRINEVQSLIYRTLYEKGEKLFGNAIESDGTKNINAVVLGMGNYGTEMVKALAWFCQMDGYRLTIHAFDKDPYAESRFKALCPDLMSDKYNGVSKEGESNYTIKIHSQIDVDTSEFLDILKTISPATFVFVSLGSDEENVKTAVNMRALSERCGVRVNQYHLWTRTVLNESTAGDHAHPGTGGGGDGALQKQKTVFRCRPRRLVRPLCQLGQRAGLGLRLRGRHLPSRPAPDESGGLGDPHRLLHEDGKPHPIRTAAGTGGAEG